MCKVARLHRWRGPYKPWVADPTRVLVVARRDVGGCLEYLCQELRRRGWNQLRCVVLEQDEKLGFPVDVHDVYDAGVELGLLLESVELVQLVDLDPLRHDIAGIPLSAILGREPSPRLCVHLSCFPEWLADDVAVRAWLDHLAAAGVATSCADPLLADKFELHYLPPFIPWWRSRWTPLQPDTRSRESIMRPAVVFASSSRAFEQRPRFEALVDRAQQAPGEHWILECLREKPHANILRRRRFAHLTLTENATGLALSALESLAQGVPVVAELGAGVAAAYAQQVEGEPPPVRPEADLETCIEGLDARARPCEVSVRWARKVLDPRRWFNFCEANWRSPAVRRVASL